MNVALSFDRATLLIFEPIIYNDANGGQSIFNEPIIYNVANGGRSIFSVMGYFYPLIVLYPKSQIMSRAFIGNSLNISPQNPYFKAGRVVWAEK